MCMRGQRGFTLIELLVGLTLLGFIVVAVTGGLRIGLTGADRVTERAVRLDTLRGVHGFLRERLEAARPVRWSDAAGTRLAFEGRADRLSFVADLPAYPDVGGLYRLTLGLDNQGLQLSRALTEGRDPKFDPEGGVTEVIAGGVGSLQIAYYGVLPGEFEPSWHDTWVQATALPDLIRIRVSDRDGSVWPHIVVAPRLGEQPR